MSTLLNLQPLNTSLFSLENLGINCIGYSLDAYSRLEYFYTLKIIEKERFYEGMLSRKGSSSLCYVG